MAAELITVRNITGDDWVNDLTKELDKYLRYKTPYWETYIYDRPFGENHLIRFPGATRGKVVVDENMIITEVTLYDGVSDCYKKEVRECLGKYVGMKLVYIEGEQHNE